MALEAYDSQGNGIHTNAICVTAAAHGYFLTYVRAVRQTRHTYNAVCWYSGVQMTVVQKRILV